jgi:hypothetical protein
MLRVRVVVGNELGTAPYDVEVPAEVPAIQLDRLVSHALGWDIDAAGLPLRHSIHADPPGRVLHSEETLAEARVWDGSTLKFETIVSAYFEAPSGAAYPLHRTEVILGRAAPDASSGATAAADSRMSDDGLINLAAEEGSKTVSHQHAQVVFSKGQWQLTHLSTRNQTILNGNVLDHSDRLTLRTGDQIELAAVTLVFRLGDPPAELRLRLPTMVRA